jgi:hypothetical protein
LLLGGKNKIAQIAFPNATGGYKKRPECYEIFLVA